MIERTIKPGQKKVFTHTNIDMVKNFVRIVIAFLLAASGLAVFLLFLQSFPQARALVDHLARDGSFDRFSEGFYQMVRVPFRVVGLALLALGSAGLAFKPQTLRLFDWILRLPGTALHRLRRDTRQFFASLLAIRMSRREWLLLVGLSLLAVLARGVYLMRPLEHDEAYTIVVFAAAPLNLGLTDYHLPNNHLFHTLLAHFAYKMFGYAPWGVRLPAFLAGVLVVPALYLLARLHFGRYVATLSAAGAALLPVLLYFGSNARGYTLVMLFSLLIFLLAAYVRRWPNLFAWLLLAVVSTLGFYTIPIFLYPFGVMMTWLFLSLVVGDIGDAYGTRWNMLAWLVGCGVLTVILTALFYMPVVFYSGFYALFSEGITTVMPWPIFWQTARSRMQELFVDWTVGVHPFLSVLAGVGALLSLIVPPVYRSPDRAGSRVPLLMAAVVWVVGFVLLQRINPWARFFTFLLPLLLMWGFAGWAGLLGFVTRRLPENMRLSAAPLVAASVLVMILLTGARLWSDPLTRFSVHGDVESVSLFLESEIQANDLVVVTTPHDAVLWYYSRLHGVNMDHYKRELPFFRMFILVDPVFNQTIESVMANRGPDPHFYDLASARMVYQSGSIQVYECIPFLDLIRSEYKLDE
jgi:hypothetical protein